MPTDPLTITLSDGQKVEAMKRFRARYADELSKLEATLTEMLTQVAEAEFLMPYLGEQPELVEQRKRKDEADVLQKRRNYLYKIIARLDEYTPQQKPITTQAPGSGGAQAPRPGSMKRY
jgi:hypothetical protein